MSAVEPATTINTALDAALRYGELGLRVIPIRQGGKYPAGIREWQKVATIDPDMIRSWWEGLYRGHGVGLALGEIAPGRWLFAVDIDGESHGVDGETTWRDLLATYTTDEPETVEAITGGGGRHLLFWTDIEPRNTGGEASKLGEGLDARGQGGQILVEPTIHPNGNPYAWVDGRAPWEHKIAQAPGWLAMMIAAENEATPQHEAEGSGTAYPDSGRLSRPDDSSTGERPGDLWAAQTPWSALLERDGWTLHHTDRDGEQHWTRPGKKRREGTSATVGYKGSDVLKVFTSSVPSLNAEETYTKIGYLAATRFGGPHNTSAAASWLRSEGFHAQPKAVDLDWIGEATPLVVDGVAPAEGDDRLAELAHVVNWETFWAADHSAESWLAFPLIPAGRAIALYAPAKAGKSTIVLSLVASVATGRPVFGTTEAEPADVLYLDYEMTEADLMERLEELGYGPDDDLTRLHYALLPSLSPLDTAEGAAMVVELARRYDAKLVVVDTFGRAVEGEEDSADTVRAFYRHTGLALKKAGVAVLRTDHSGKSLDKGQRGSSAKADDVDVVWRLTRRDNGAQLQRTHSRVSWVPENVELRREEHHDGTVSYSAKGGTYPTGTRQVAEMFDRLEIPVDASVRQVRDILTEEGEKCSRSNIGPAQKMRREMAAANFMRDIRNAESEADAAIRNTPRNTLSTGHGTQETDHSERLENSRSEDRNTPSERFGTPVEPDRNSSPPIRGNGSEAASDEVDDEAVEPVDDQVLGKPHTHVTITADESSPSVPSAATLLGDEEHHGRDDDF